MGKRGSEEWLGDKLTGRQVKRARRFLEEKRARRLSAGAPHPSPVFDISPEGDNPDYRHEDLGIVASVHGSHLSVLRAGHFAPCDPADLVLPAGIAGLVVGDRLVCSPAAEGQLVASQLLPRSSKLVRMREDRSRRSEQGREEHVLAANVDYAVIVAAAAAPAFHPRLVDRYMVMCQYGNVAPLICLNKIDLAASPPDLSVYQDMGIPVVYVSATSGQGLDSLRDLLRGRTSVLTGHSGVGKSSILNRLVGEEKARVGAVSSVDGSGRHTTAATSLHVVDESTCLIDTPGIRSLGLWQIARSDVRFYFPEFQQLAPLCQFHDCLHLSEPGCTVKAGVADGAIARTRYDSYVRLMGE